MIQLLTCHREPIAEQLTKVIDGAAGHLDRVNSWAPDLRGRLSEFATRGKLVRGSLVAVGARVFGHEPDIDVYQIAAALELIQSFLLIHDDIMDKDATRRGAPAIYEQYRQTGVQSGFGRSRQFGESMGICGGDVAMLLAFEAVATTSLDPSLRIDLVRRIAGEIGDVGIAQMADVANGHGRDPATETEILSVHRWKTGRYTFSLPLMLGARIAEAPEAEAENLGHWGELQGIIFQIRDDQLGLMEDGNSTGKPVGSDVTADKKTLHRLKLFAAAPGTRWEAVPSYFGNPISSGQLGEIRDALAELGVLDEIEDEVRRLNSESDLILEQLDLVSDAARCELREIAQFNLGRRR